MKKRKIAASPKLIRLKAILYCLEDSEADDLNTLYMKTPLLQAKLKKQAKSTPFSLNSNPNLNGISIRNIPNELSSIFYSGRNPSFSEFGSSKILESNLSMQPVLMQAETSTQEARLSQAIQYLFSDGAIVPAGQVFFYPAAQNIPHRVLPLLKQERKYRSNEPLQLPFRLIRRLQQEERKEKIESLKELEWALISVLLHAEPVPIWLTFGVNTQEDRWILPLSSINTRKISKSSWSLAKLPDSTPEEDLQKGVVALEFQRSPSQSKNILFSCFELDPISQSLSFHSVEESFKEIWGQFNGENSSPFLVHGHLQIQKSLEKFDKTLKSLNCSPIQREAIISLSERDSQNQIWISPSGNLRVCRKWKIKTEGLEKNCLSVWNFPACFHLLLLGFRSGLLGVLESPFFEKENNETRTFKTDRDLKFIRHSGIFSLLLLELSNFLVHADSEKIQEDSFKEFLQELYVKLGQALIQIEKKAGFVDLDNQTSLEKLCSKQVLKTVELFIIRCQEYLQSEFESVFCGKTEYRLQGAWLFSMQVLSQCIAKIANQTQAQCFFKPRFALFSNAPLQDSQILSVFETNTAVDHDYTAAECYQLSQSWMALPDFFQSMLDLESKNFKIFYREMSLKRMEIKELRPEFQLVETESLQAGNPSQNIDWFELHPRFFFQGVQIDPKKFRQISQEGMLEFQGQIYLVPERNLPSLRKLESFWAKIQTTEVSTLKRKNSARIFPLPRSQTLEMLALRAAGIAVHGGPRWKKICTFYDGLDKGTNDFQCPSGLKAELKDYQKKGVQWILDLYSLCLGGILADDMGLGKTIQTLGFLEVLREKQEMDKVLIVVPTSLTYNWASEAERFTPELPVHLFQGRAKGPTIEFLKKFKQGAVVITYGLFTEHQKFLEEFSWNILIFDEAQNLKNITAKRTTASRRVKARFKLCLTGTPLENHLGEFFSLMDLVVSGCLGDLNRFREKFFRSTQIQASDIKDLKLKSRPLILRRTKDQILSELPPKLETTIKLPFEKNQEKIYRDIALAWNEKVKSAILDQESSGKTQLLMLTALLRLRQACSDPSAIPKVQYPQTPPKVCMLLEALQEIIESGQSALVFTQFLHTFDRIKKELIRLAIPFYSIHGATSRKEREQLLSAFQGAETGAILLMTLKTGGVGLNLVKATYVFHLEPWWNPAVENQATDRVHRIGQNKAVQVYRYLMRESVEEKIELLKARKSAQFNTLFAHSENVESLATQGTRLSQADFEYLLLS